MSPALVNAILVAFITATAGLTVHTYKAGAWFASGGWAASSIVLTLKLIGAF